MFLPILMKRGTLFNFLEDLNSKSGTYSTSFFNILMLNYYFIAGEMYLSYPISFIFQDFIKS